MSDTPNVEMEDSPGIETDVRKTELHPLAIKTDMSRDVPISKFVV